MPALGPITPCLRHPFRLRRRPILPPAREDLYFPRPDTLHTQALPRLLLTMWPPGHLYFPHLEAPTLSKLLSLNSRHMILSMWTSSHPAPLRHGSNMRQSSATRHRATLRHVSADLMAFAARASATDHTDTRATSACASFPKPRPHLSRHPQQLLANRH